MHSSASLWPELKNLWTGFPKVLNKIKINHSSVPLCTRLVIQNSSACFVPYLPLPAFCSIVFIQKLPPMSYNYTFSLSSAFRSTLILFYTFYLTISFVISESEQKTSKDVHSEVEVMKMIAIHLHQQVLFSANHKSTEIIPFPIHSYIPTPTPFLFPCIIFSYS